jgi:RNA polymerase sigma-70 factor (ECF subfamily)
MDDDKPSLRAETTAPGGDRGDVARLTDPELVELIARQSHAALAEVYNRHGGTSHSLAARLCEPHADDMVQHVFLRLWHQPHHFDVHRGSLRSFLMMQIRRRSTDLRCTSGSHQEGETGTGVERLAPADDVALAHLVGERCWLLLSRLDEGQRSAIALAYFGGHTYREVAVLLAVTEGTVRSRIRHGLTQLRVFIEPHRAGLSQP